MPGEADKTPEPNQANETASAEGEQAEIGVPTTEQELASPDSQTLRLLGVIFSVTLVCWIGSKAACNKRDSPVRSPIALTLAQARETGKSSALEFAQRMATCLWEDAATLATPEAAQAIEPFKKGSAAVVSGCGKEDVYTRAIVHKRRRNNMKITTHSSGPGLKQTLDVTVERQDKSWRVTQFSIPGAPLPAKLKTPSLQSDAGLVQPRSANSKKSNE